jgi:hypothetical protein
MEKKPFKTGSTFYTDSNFNVMKFTRKQAEALMRTFKRKQEARFTNGFKFKHCELIEKPGYFCYSMS